MRIQLGAFEFPNDSTVPETQLVLHQGLPRRKVRVLSILRRYPNRASYHAALEALQTEIERFDCGTTELVFDSQRWLRGQCQGCRITREDRYCTAVVDLEVVSQDRFEYALEESQVQQGFVALPQPVDLTPGGNWYAEGEVVIHANTTLTEPVVTCGTSSLVAAVTLNAGDELRINSAQRSALLNNSSVLHLVSGEFPKLWQPSTTLVLSGGYAEPVESQLTITWRNRWV